MGVGAVRAHLARSCLGWARSSNPSVVARDRNRLAGYCCLTGPVAVSALAGQRGAAHDEPGDHSRVAGGRRPRRLRLRHRRRHPHPPLPCAAAHQHAAAVRPNGPGQRYRGLGGAGRRPHADQQPALRARYHPSRPHTPPPRLHLRALALLALPPRRRRDHHAGNPRRSGGRRHRAALALRRTRRHPACAPAALGARLPRAAPREFGI